MSVLSQFLGGGGAAVGEIVPMPAHYVSNFSAQGREYLRTGFALPYAAKYAPTVAAAPQLALRGSLVSIPNVGTLGNNNLVSPNGGTSRLFHVGVADTQVFLSTDSGASYSAVGSLGVGAPGACIAAGSNAFVALNAVNGGDLTVQTAPASGTPWTTRVTDAVQGTTWRGGSCFIATNSTAWFACGPQSGGIIRTAFRAAASPEGTWTVGFIDHNSNTVGLAGIPSGNFAIACVNYVGTSPDGQTWTARTLPANGTWTNRGLCYTGARLILVGSATGSSKAMAHSTDGGATWSLTPNLPTELLASHSDCGIASDGAGTVILWESISGTTEFRFWRSTDHGVTWSDFNPISSQAGGVAFSQLRMKWAPGLGYFIGAHSTAQAITLTPAQVSGATPDAIGVRLASQPVANTIHNYVRVL